MSLFDSRTKKQVSRTWLSGILLLLSTLALAATAQASFYKSGVGTKASSLLNGRLSIHAPATSGRDELTIDLRSEKNLFKDQTVLEYRKNGKALRIVATELFAWRTENLQGNLAKLIYNYPQKVGLKYKTSQINRHRYELIPSQLVVIKGMAVVRSLFFVNSDDTIQSIDIYMNADAVRDSTKAALLAKKLLASIKSGKRKLRKGPGTVHLGTKAKPHYFKIYLPKGYVISSKTQGNARVHIIRKLVPLGKSQTSLAIYIGNESSPYHSHFGDYDTSYSAASSTLLGRFIHWHKVKKAASMKRRMAKASQRLPWSDKNASGRQFYIHIFADSETKKGMKKMVRLAGKLRYVNKPRNNFASIEPGQPGHTHTLPGTHGRVAPPAIDRNNNSSGNTIKPIPRKQNHNQLFSEYDRQNGSDDRYRTDRQYSYRNNEKRHNRNDHRPQPYYYPGQNDEYTEPYYDSDPGADSYQDDDYQESYDNGF